MSALHVPHWPALPHCGVRMSSRRPSDASVTRPDEHANTDHRRRRIRALCFCLQPEPNSHESRPRRRNAASGVFQHTAQISTRRRFAFARASLVEAQHQTLAGIGIWHIPRWREATAPDGCAVCLAIGRCVRSGAKVGWAQPAESACRAGR